MLFKVINIAVLICCLIGCGGRSQKKLETEGENISLSDRCLNASTILAKTRHLNRMNFGDGSDGEFYLASEESFQLEEKTYNFTNVNLDQGSLLTVVNGLSVGMGLIQINSLGVCNLLGDVDLVDYSGEFVLNCGSDIMMSGTYTHLNGNTTLSASDSLLNSEETSTNITSSTISSDSIDISGAELSTISVNVQEGAVNYSPETIVIDGGSQIISEDEVFVEVEAESGDESLTMCSI